ncbi:hypothetical protein [Kiloniella laminariae]|uniref:hypothetical protein n=1 Tax=Kiloniella laminariae TaxID=454162 RepID=UPI0003A79064|nr:hypothetical protein [Kiloniella laminariae]
MKGAFPLRIAGALLSAALPLAGRAPDDFRSGDLSSIDLSSKALPFPAGRAWERLERGDPDFVVLGFAGFVMAGNVCLRRSAVYCE